MEEILRKYFDCKVPFRKDGTLTTTGKNAVSKLISLLNDMEYCGILEAKEPISEINAFINDKFFKPND